jgi:hypothetical protein
VSVATLGHNAPRPATPLHDHSPLVLDGGPATSIGLPLLNPRRRRCRWLAIAAVSVAVLGSLAAAPAVAKLPWGPVPSRTVAVGDGDGSQQRRGLVVRGEKRWRKVWRSLTAGAEPRPPIEFSRLRLLVASQGRQPSSGHRLRMTSVGGPGGVLIVDVADVSPGKGCLSGVVLTSPYHVVRVPRTDIPVRFFRHPRVKRCG